MNWELLFVFGLLVFALVSFVRERIPTDVTALVVFSALLVAGFLPFAHTLPRPEALLGVLSNHAPLTVAAMFVLSAALVRCGAIEELTVRMERMTRFGFTPFLILLILGVAAMSAFVNNTPVVVVLLPVVLAMARKLDVPASKLLIPLSYASIFGGVCTLLGTSTNILASGLLEKAGHAPLRMFELAAVGLPLLFVGALYLCTIGQRLLPRRETLTSLLSEEDRREYLTEVFVQAGSPVVGKTLAGAGLLGRRGLRILEIRRGGVNLTADLRQVELAEGDRLVLASRPSGVAHARSIAGVEVGSIKEMGIETIAEHEGSIVEAVVGPGSPLIGKSLKDLRFRQRFQLLALAVHRRGVNVREQIETLPLRFGDTLLLMGADPAIQEMRSNSDLLLLDRPPTPSVGRRKKAPIVLGVLASIVGVASVTPVPIVVAAVVGCAILLLTDCLRPREAYAAVDWPILVLIFGMLGLGLAMETTGAADLVARSLAALASHGVREEWRPYVLLALAFLVTSTATEVLSNNAAVVLMIPISINLAAGLAVDPRPFVIATCIAASASFSTPVGYQTNTYVYGVGGYRFADFLRIGVPLNILYGVVSVLLIPRLWPF